MGHGGSGEVPQLSADVLPRCAGGDCRLRYHQPGHIRARQELGEGAAAAGVPLDSNRTCRQQERPRSQTYGGVRRGAGLCGRERTSVHGDERQDRYERQRHIPSYREQVTKERRRRRGRRRGRAAPRRRRPAALHLLLQVMPPQNVSLHGEGAREVEVCTVEYIGIVSGRGDPRPATRDPALWT